MGIDAQRPQPVGVAAAVGDLVCGLAAVSPPAPFVGELGSPADTAAQAVVGGLLRSAGAIVRTRPTVRINGRRVGTTAEVASAIPASPTPGIARMPTGSGVARVGGAAITLHGGPAFLQPSSAIANLGGGQTVVRLSGAGPGVEPQASSPSPSPSSLDELRKSIPRRTTFEPASALHRMISQCSPARRLDLAPAEHEVLVGDPVNVVTGAVITHATDFEQPWPALRWERRYDSRRSDRTSTLGPGWCHALDQAVLVEPGRVVLRDGDGREKEFDMLHLPGRACRPGDVLRDPTQRFRLRCVGSRRWELHDGRSLRQFAPVPGEPEDGPARLHRLARHDGVVVECGYEAGRLVEVRVDGAAVLRLEHDERGRLHRLYSVGADGELLEASYGYSSEGDLVRVTDALGHERRYEYAGHLLVKETNRDGGSFYYGYDGVGPHARCVRTWGDGGRLDRALEHHPDEGRTTVRDGLGREIGYRYDAAGLVTEITPTGGARQTFRYDEQLRLVEVGWPDGTTQTARYDAAGNLVRRTERDGASWTMAYDAHGRLMEGVDPAGGRWRLHHDERGRLRELEDPCGHATRFELDRGQCRVVDATGHAFVIGLDAQQRVTELPAADGGRLRFWYDPRGRLAAVRGTDGRQASWGYDPRGRLVRFEGAAGRTSWRRSAEGSVVDLEHAGRSTRIARDSFGTIEAIEAEGRTTRYAHDREGQLVGVREGDAELLALERASDGRVVAVEVRDRGRWELRREPCDGRVVALRLPGDEGDEVEITWDAAGRITRVEHGRDRVSTYVHRPDGYLVEAANEHIACAFERDPRGVVLSQRWGDEVVDEAFPDHRGRRSGLRLRGRGRLSYLRSIEGSVERIAAFAEGELEPLVLSPAEPPQAGAPAQLPALETTAFDALGRPVSPRGPAHLVWDEDRLLTLGDAWLVHHPEDLGPSFVIDGEGVVTTIADPTAGLRPQRSAPTALDRAYEAAFPPVAPAPAPGELPTPTARLGALLGHRVWTPEVRPVPGTAPWDPDRWGPRLESPTPETGRLSPEALLRAMGVPFPRPELAIRPAPEDAEAV